LFFPVLLQVFGLHLGSLFLTLRTTPVLFASVPLPGSTQPPSYSKQTAQKNETHPCSDHLSVTVKNRKFIRDYNTHIHGRRTESARTIAIAPRMCYVGYWHARSRHQPRLASSSRRNVPVTGIAQDTFASAAGASMQKPDSPGRRFRFTSTPVR
jgi:hypothetical protein